MDRTRMTYLVDRCLSGVCTTEEKEELADWISTQHSDDELAAALEHAWRDYQPGADVMAMAGPALDRVEANLFRSEKQQQPGAVITMNRRRRWWMTAAVVLLLAGAATWSVVRLNRNDKVTAVAPVTLMDAAPGSNKAVLTLAGGKRIVLDSAVSGTLAREGNAKIEKLANGELVYKVSPAANDETVYHTLSTPRGGQYQLTLPDGTKVWLNAASSITYPTAFSGTQRKVSITGEAYFEVAGKAGAPFSVSINEHTEVEVLGTRFNVNAYGDEASINTTLLQGAVRVVASDRTQLLAPGQQAQVSNGPAPIRLIRDADINGAIAWKDGSFAFTNADLHTVMRQLARWYNVEVRYEGNVPDAKFTGEIERELSLSQVLKGLTNARINYRIEKGNKLVILP